MEVIHTTRGGRARRRIELALLSLIALLFLACGDTPTETAVPEAAAPERVYSMHGDQLPGLRAWWPGEGNAEDVMGSHHGVLVGSAGFAEGNVGGAFALDGGGYVEMPGLSAGATWTVEAWVNVAAVQPTDNNIGLDQRRGIAGSMGGCSDWGLVTRQQPDGLHFGTVIRSPSACTATIRDPDPLLPGEWYHVAGTNDGATARIYVNGQLRASGPVSGNYGGGGAFRVGREAWCNCNSFAGLVDELRIYDRALTPEEIASIYESSPSTNSPPVADAGGPYIGTEGNILPFDGSASLDPDGDPLTFTWDLGEADLATGIDTQSPEATFSDDGTYSVALTVDDGRGGRSTATTLVEIQNVAPTITSFAGPTDPIRLGEAGAVAALDLAFDDPGADTFVAEVACGDGATISASVIPLSTTVSCLYMEPGVFTPVVTVSDDDGGTSLPAAFQYLVIYDPSAGFVTGGGWIHSPEGACTLSSCTETTTGKATFGFVSRYKKGATTPSGNTQFRFKAADLAFQSTAYEWLVVAGARAQFKGSGQINDEGDYGFLLTAIDGDVSGGGGTDRFRIKIWNRTNDEVVYDNQRNADDTAELTTAIGGGNIRIQR